MISKRSEIVLPASVTARICHICTSTIFCSSIQDKIQTMLKNREDHLHRQATARFDMYLYLNQEAMN